MTLANVTRVVVVLAACAAAVGSATSNTNQNQSLGQNEHATNSSAPPPQDMEPSRALGLWKSTFGAVKIEADGSKGGIEAGAVQGVWVYERHGQEVIGYFAGNLRGNVLNFRWQEPNNPPLVGEGYLVFDQSGRQYTGRWWSEKKDRVGDWNGWRAPVPAGNPNPGADQPYEAEDAGMDTSEPPPRQPAPRPRRPAPQPTSQPQPTYY